MGLLSGNRCKMDEYRTIQASLLRLKDETARLKEQHEQILKGNVLVVSAINSLSKVIQLRLSCSERVQSAAQFELMHASSLPSPNQS
jgi:hypothetical protein